jgi:hypothetical protein
VEQEERARDRAEVIGLFHRDAVVLDGLGNAGRSCAGD